MKKKLLGLFFAGLIISGILQAQTIDKDVLFTQIEEKYSGFKEISGQLEVNIKMLGIDIKVPSKFWQKTEKMRMDMETTIPGVPIPMEQVLIINGKELLQYQKMTNTLLFADLTKMSKEVRNMVISNQTSFLGGKEIISEVKKIKDEVEVEEKKTDGKTYYILSLKNINKFGNVSAMKGMCPNEIFTKMAYWIDSKSFNPSKIELYSENSETPGLTIDIIEFKTDSISDEVFKMKLPENVKQVDITETMEKMFNKIKPEKLTTK